MFKSIKIKNLRAITELEINNLGQVNLFVGNNNCGKTTILEALFFIIGNNNPNLPVSANAFRGLNFLSNEYWDSFFHNMEADSNIRISVILHKMQEEQKLVIRPVIKKQTTAKPVSSDIVSIGIQNGDAKPAFTPNGLELIYTSSQDPTAKSISSIVLKGNELITEGTKESFVRGVFVGPATKFDWKTRLASIQRKKRVGELISSLKEIESDISDIRINEVGILEADVGLCKLIPVNLMGGGLQIPFQFSLACWIQRTELFLLMRLKTAFTIRYSKKSGKLSLSGHKTLTFKFLPQRILMNASELFQILSIQLYSAPKQNYSVLKGKTKNSERSNIAKNYSRNLSKATGR